MFTKLTDVFRWLRLVALGVALLCIDGCAPAPTSSAGGIESVWSLRFDSPPRVIDVSEYRILLELDREYGAEIVSLNASDGSYRWSRTVLYTQRAALVDDRIIIYQPVAQTPVVLALDSSNGEEVWKKGFADDIIGSTADGVVVLSSADGSMYYRSRGGGAAEDATWTVPEDCYPWEEELDSRARVLYVAYSCEGESSEVAVIDVVTFDVLDTYEVAESEPEEWLSATATGDFVLVNSSVDATTLIFGENGRLLTTGSYGIHSAEMRGTDLVLIGIDGTTTVTPEGAVSNSPDEIHRAIEATYLSSDALSATRYSAFDVSTNALTQTFVSHGRVSETSYFPTSGDLLLATEDDDVYTLQRLTTRNTELPSSDGDGLVISLADFALPGYANGLQGFAGDAVMTSGFGDQAEVTFYSDEQTADSPQSVVSATVVQFTDHESAVLEIWDEDADIDTGTISGAEYASRGSRFVAVIGRCALYGSQINVSPDLTTEVIRGLVDRIESGCDD